MPVGIHTSHLPPAYRRGLLAPLVAAGAEVDPVDPDVVLVPLLSTADCPAFADAAAGDTAVVALVRPLDAATAAHAFGHGAAGAADWEAEPDTIAEAALAAAAGRVVLPREIAVGLLQAPPAHGPETPLSPEERRWLTALGRGVTVVRLADDEGYSERAMFRRLHDLYVRLGATNRSEAMLTAQRLGLLGD